MLLLVSKIILYILLGIPLTAAGVLLVLKVFATVGLFISSHKLFCLTLIAALALTVYILLWLRAAVRSKSIKRSKVFLILATFAIYAYFSFVMGAGFPFEYALNTVSPIKFTYTQFKDDSISSNSGQKFPFWKAYIIRIWNDLPLKAKPYPRYHFITEADFYYDDMHNIDRAKSVICVFKNLGNKPLLVKKIKSIKIYRNDRLVLNNRYVKSIDGDAVVYFNEDKPGLVDAVNMFIQSRPFVLYPQEEAFLFKVGFACSGERIIVEVEMQYEELFNKTGRECSYRQIDDVSFKGDKNRALSASNRYLSICE